MNNKPTDHMNMLPDYWYNKKICYLKTPHLLRLLSYIDNDVMCMGLG